MRKRERERERKREREAERVYIESTREELTVRQSS
jgi:hypothetical protein